MINMIFSIPQAMAVVIVAVLLGALWVVKTKR